jgi:hypothetical protein
LLERASQYEAYECRKALLGGFTFERRHSSFIRRLR